MSKITDSARGEDCLIRIPGVCNFDPATTVYCHISGGGMGAKADDMHGAYGCHDCHAEVDGRTQKIADRCRLLNWFYEGVFRTQLVLKDKGLL